MRIVKMERRGEERRGEERRGEESQAGEISEEIYYNVLNSMSERNQPARQS